MASPTAPTLPPTAQGLAQAPGRAEQPPQSLTAPQTTQATARRDVPPRMATMAQLRTLRRVNYQVSFIHFVNKIRYATFCANKDSKNPHWAINKHIMDVCWLQTVNVLFNRFPKRNAARSKARLIKAVAQKEGAGPKEARKLRKYWAKKYCANTSKGNLAITPDRHLNPADYFSKDALSVWTAHLSELAAAGADDLTDSLSRLAVGGSAMDLDLPDTSATAASPSPTDASPNTASHVISQATPVTVSQGEELGDKNEDKRVGRYRHRIDR